MRPKGSTLKPAQVNETMMNGLRQALRDSGRRWRRLDREELKSVLLDLQKRRKDIIRQEDLYSLNDPLRLGFQCQRAVVDLHILELRKVAVEKEVRLSRVW